MAKIKDNLAMQGISGKLGNQVVYRRVGDKIIVVAKPRRKPTTHPTLISQNNRFRLASTYAKNALQDPVLKDLYTAEAKRRGVINAYNMAVSDYLKAPEIRHINAEAYTGTQKGELITIEVSDNFKVVQVKVTISHGEETVEEGNAVLTADIWQYATTALNPALSGSKIVVTALDRPNNRVTKEKFLGKR